MVGLAALATRRAVRQINEQDFGAGSEDLIRPELGRAGGDATRDSRECRARRRQNLLPWDGKRNRERMWLSGHLGRSSAHVSRSAPVQPSRDERRREPCLQSTRDTSHANAERTSLSHSFLGLPLASRPASAGGLKPQLAGEASPAGLRRSARRLTPVGSPALPAGRLASFTPVGSPARVFIPRSSPRPAVRCRSRPVDRESPFRLPVRSRRTSTLACEGSASCTMRATLAHWPSLICTRTGDMCDTPLRTSRM